MPIPMDMEILHLLLLTSMDTEILLLLLSTSMAVAILQAAVPTSMTMTILLLPTTILAMAVPAAITAVIKIWAERPHC